MKILLVNKFHYMKGGSETYYFGLSELLRQHGHEVIHFSMEDEKNAPCDQAKYFVGNVDFNAPMGKMQQIRSGLRLLYSREAKKKFRQLLEDERPDVIHLNIFQSQLTGSIVDVARSFGIPVVYTAHDLKSICPNYQAMGHGEVCEKCFGGKYTNCLRTGCMKDSKMKSLLATAEAYVYQWRKIYRKIDLVITPSAFYREKIGASGVFRCPIVHMTNFLPPQTEYRAMQGGEDYFLYFGRLSREKGILTLVRAFAASQTPYPLYIVGTGPEREQIEQLIAELHLTERVKLLGFKRGEELRELVAGARAVCLLSEWYENGPYSIMEALSMGKACIVSNIGGLPELIEDGVNGVTVPPGNVEEIARVLDTFEPPNGEAIAARAKERFSAESYVKQLIRHYEELL